MVRDFDELPPPAIRRSIVRLYCSDCGTETDAKCNCGKPYVPKLALAAAAIKANPEKSNRAIADEIGADEKTIRKARAGADSPHHGIVVGLDGKHYPVQPTFARRPAEAVVSEAGSVALDRLRASGPRAATIFKAFNKAVELILNTCEQCVEVDIPQLNSDQQIAALGRVKETMSMLREFSNRIKESSHNE